MNEEPRQLVADPLPSEGEMNDFRQHLDNLKDEKYRRLDQISSLRKNIKENLQFMEITLLDEYDEV